MKKRLFSILMLVVLLSSLLAMAIPVAALESTVLEITGKASGYMDAEGLYGPKFSNFTAKGNSGLGNNVGISMDFNNSYFYTDQACKTLLKTAPVKGQTYYFYMESKPRMDTDFSKLKTENCKLTMDGITPKVLSITRKTETKPNNPATYYYVRIVVSAKIDALPIDKVTISGFSMPTVGAYPDTSVTVNSNCNVQVTWRKGIKTNVTTKPSTEKIAGADILVASFTITPITGYYFPNNGSGTEVVESNGLKLGVIGHGKNEIRLQTDQIRMDKLTKVDWLFNGVELNSTDGYYYLVTIRGNATFSSGASYRLEAPDRYLFSDAELKKPLKKEPKEGTTYYTRISLRDTTAIPTFAEFDCTKNLTVKVDGFDVAILKQSYERDGFSGDKIWFYLSLTKQIPKYTISFNHGGGSGIMKQVVMEEGKYTLPECTFTAPAGKQFKAWLVSGRERDPGYAMTVRENMTLTAVWEDIPAVTYKVTFASGGGTGTMKVVETSGEYALPKNGFTAPSGKQFKCWKVNGAQKQPGDQIVVTANTTITAEWENVPVTTYKVTFAAGGGKGVMKAATDIAGSYTLPECDFSAPTGQRFKCWKVDGAQKQPGESIYVSANKQVTAVWEDIPEEPTVPDVTEPTEPDVTEPTEPDVTEPTEPDVTEPTEPDVTEPTEPDVTEPTETTEKQDQTKPQEQPSEDDADQAQGIPVWAIILICVGCVAIGLLVTVLIVFKKK